MIEAYKSLNKPSPDNHFDSLFTSKRRQDPLQNDLLVLSVKTVTKGKDSAKCLGAATQNSISSHIRQQDSLEKFRGLITKWKPDCKCKLCKDYIGHIGYIQIVEQFPFIYLFFFIAAIVYLFLTNFEHFWLCI